LLLLQSLREFAFPLQLSGLPVQLELGLRG
jgi:hypothetical protein